MQRGGGGGWDPFSSSAHSVSGKVPDTLQLNQYNHGNHAAVNVNKDMNPGLPSFTRHDIARANPQSPDMIQLVFRLLQSPWSAGLRLFQKNDIDQKDKSIQRDTTISNHQQGKK